MRLYTVNFPSQSALSSLKINMNIFKGSSIHKWKTCNYLSRQGGSYHDFIRTRIKDNFAPDFQMRRCSQFLMLTFECLTYGYTSFCD